MSTTKRNNVTLIPTDKENKAKKYSVVMLLLAAVSAFFAIVNHQKMQNAHDMSEVGHAVGFALAAVGAIIFVPSGIVGLSVLIHLGTMKDVFLKLARLLCVVAIVARVFLALVSGGGGIGIIPAVIGAVLDIIMLGLISPSNINSSPQTPKGHVYKFKG